METFQILYIKNIDTAFIQETHSTPEWKEWKEKSLWYSAQF